MRAKGSGTFYEKRLISSSIHATTKWNFVVEFTILKNTFRVMWKSRRNATGMKSNGTREEKNNLNLRYKTTNNLTEKIVSHKPKRKYLIVEKMAPFSAILSSLQSWKTQLNSQKERHLAFITFCDDPMMIFFLLAKKTLTLLCNLFSVCDESMIQI